ncbi:ROK family glucokinase [Luteipulveratus flavus]|uniref:Glucokinase n=1 Tax=Luteipulveratus flavus TaxID=3031728 RepID=A0ABT6CA91_9MICO|nr:ROK family glucokinase [Luteipulveratus sp. YIM 133296]MDF8265793.1 ROK family glucokinase [Luteipulveratus sp. YIM 133296]
MSERATTGTTIGLDVGGTKIAAAVVDHDGRVLRREHVPTPASNPDAIVAALAGLVSRLGSDDTAAVGVACAGYLDAERESIRFAPNLAWRDFPLRALLAQACGRTVVMENDADAAAYGELLHGAAQDADNMVLVTLGTGVGGAVVTERSLRRGAFGIGGELGHIRVERNGRPCPCGLRGCLEAYASGNALLAQARAAVTAGDPRATALGVRCGQDVDRLTGPDVTALAQDGDPLCVDLVAEVGRWLGEGLASIAAVVDPGLVVVGGGLSAAGDLVLEPLRTAYEANLTGQGHRPLPDVVPARLVNDAGMIGAAALAREAQCRTQAGGRG